MSIVYFIGNDDFVKIGQSIDPERRLRDLQTGSPVILRLLAVDEHGVEEEYHRKLDLWRMHGEWFRHDGLVAVEIFELNLKAGKDYRVPQSIFDPAMAERERLSATVRDLAATNHTLLEKYDSECLAHAETRVRLDHYKHDMRKYKEAWQRADKELEEAKRQ